MLKQNNVVKTNLGIDIDDNIVHIFHDYNNKLHTYHYSLIVGKVQSIIIGKKKIGISCSSLANLDYNEIVDTTIKFESEKDYIPIEKPFVCNDEQKIKQLSKMIAEWNNSIEKEENNK